MQPDTIVLVHGFWVTPRAWENWIAHYENKGLRVIAPPCPGFEVEVEALNADPPPIGTVTVPAVFSALEKITPAEGVAVVPLSQVRSTVPVLKDPADRHRAVGFDYKADGTAAEVTVFPGRSHLMPAQDGWQEIADHALGWALAHTSDARISAAKE
ncbi:hypothetical protein [Streptomyces sp. NPDC096311]|uniref:hypothetical protein n=1 Tax=Streptomyces sp. NPDC096311 TaxID=3366083 RepID=UPI0038102CFA